MLTIKGYTIVETLSQGKYFTVYRAIKESDGQKVILKICRLEQPTFHELASLRHEYQLLKQLDVPFIVKPLDLIKHQHQLVLVLNDIQGITLKQYMMKYPLSLTDFFKFALQIVEGLHALHQQNIIHKDINPSNVIIDPTTSSVQLIDLSISSQLTQENQAVTPENLEGTLAYLSPEQTGRMNCVVDYRADFYSLGITFYEMLTGKCPFEAEDPLQLIYNHLTVQAKPVTDIKPEVPNIVADIVAKLMAKLPEERYINILGLKADLLNCQQQWKKKNQITSFTLGQQDFSERLNLSHKLYGREEATQQLLAAFERISIGPSELLLVAGYSGIGKTSLVKEIYKPITRQKGYFLSGKFDQLQRTTPYSAFIEAFQELATRLLALPPAQLALLKNRLLAALGNNGQVIIDVVPLVAMIIGEQPPIPELPAEQAQQRFILTFQDFVRALAQPEHPIVLFLDDLQWADMASLQLLSQLVSDNKLQHFLLLGAYRDNEVTHDHPFMILLQTLQKNSVAMSTINLAPLPIHAINQLLADSFNCPQREIAPLAEIIFAKTQGNPFFTNEFIKVLYQQQLLHFSHEHHRWHWDIARIEHQKVTDNVVELLLNRMRELSKKGQQLISLAACMGHIFDLQTLATISEQSLAQTAEHLWPIVQANFIKPLGNNYQLAQAFIEIETDLAELSEKLQYQFVHDRIQQAAYGLITDRTRQQTHLNIGRLLLKGQVLQADDKRLFEVLNQFNNSLELIANDAERLQLAQYNLWAGQKAKQSNAYQAALSYVKSGIQLLTTECWKKQYELSFELYKILAECSFLTSDYEGADRAIEVLIKNAASDLYRTEIYIIKLGMLNVLNKQEEAINIGLTALKRLGIKFPARPNTLHLLMTMLEVKWHLGKRKLDKLDLSPMTDAKYIMIDKLLVRLINIAYFVDQNLFALLIFKAASINFQYGYTENTPFNLSTHAIISLHSLKRYEEALAFAALSEKISPLLPTSTTLGRPQYVLGCFIKLFSHPSDVCFEYVRRGYNLCFENGDLSYALYTLVEIALKSFAVGKPLSEVKTNITNTLAFKKRSAINEFDYCMRVFDNVVDNLQSDSLTVDKLLIFKEQSHNTDITLTYNFNIIYYYLSGNFEKALKDCIANEPYQIYMLGQINYMQNQFFYALTLIACYKKAGKKDRRQYLKKIKSLHKELKVWSEWCPVNFQHYDLLIAAEIQHITKPTLQTISLYDQAIKVAHEQENLLVIGIANECAAQFYNDLDKPHLAKVYLQAAYYAYQQWGAVAKCRLLDASYTNKIQDAATLDSTTIHSGTMMGTTSSTTSTSIDVLSILKSAQAISSEIRLDKLLKKLLYILLENAGAERAIFLIKERGRWYVKAEGDIVVQHVELAQAEPIDMRKDLPISLIQYVQHSKQQLLLQNPQDFDRYTPNDSYLEVVKPQSILILPVKYQSEITCLFYLENKTISCAFTPAQIQTLQLLASQAAISVENAQLYYQATHDGLTGLANRNLLHYLFERAQAKAKRNNTHIAILFFDLDGFKHINDTWGHEAGDKLLLHFTDLLKSKVRESDLAARLGGDEFIVMMEDLTDIHQAGNFAGRFLQSLKEPVKIDGQLINIASSIGISVFPENGADIQTLTKQADEALYKVKQAGKNNYQYYSDIMK